MVKYKFCLLKDFLIASGLFVNSLNFSSKESKTVITEIRMELHEDWRLLAFMTHTKV